MNNGNASNNTSGKFGSKFIEIVILIVILIIVSSMANCIGSCIKSGSNNSSFKGSSHHCAVCGKSTNTKLTEDQKYYCSEHYADAWNYYYGKK